MLRNGRECRRCGYINIKPREKGPRDYKMAAELAWVTRRKRFGPRGMNQRSNKGDIELFG